jgi:hypothetical protein
LESKEIKKLLSHISEIVEKLNSEFSYPNDYFVLAVEFKPAFIGQGSLEITMSKTLWQSGLSPFTLSYFKTRMAPAFRPPYFVKLEHANRSNNPIVSLTLKVKATTNFDQITHFVEGQWKMLERTYFEFNVLPDVL